MWPVKMTAKPTFCLDKLLSWPDIVRWPAIILSPGPLKDTNSTAIIKFMKVQFSRHGIPDVLVSDNGSQFTSREFTDFTTQWEFQHVMSSQYHPKSNGKAESAVKVVKGLFKKAVRDNKDQWLSLLQLHYRDTPTTAMQTSPAQWLMSRRTKILVP